MELFFQVDYSSVDFIYWLHESAILDLKTACFACFCDIEQIVMDDIALIFFIDNFFVQIFDGSMIDTYCLSMRGAQIPSLAAWRILNTFLVTRFILRLHDTNC